MKEIKIGDHTVDVETFQEWLDSLRSGKYSQGTGCLQSSDGFCCLGVACDLFVSKNEIRFNDAGHVAGTLPNDQSGAPFWLQHINKDFGNKTGIKLFYLNDGGGVLEPEPQFISRLTFDEIADCLQAVYIEKVLD